MRKGKRFLSLPVLAVFLLMIFVYYSTIFIFLHDWVGLQTSPGTLNAVIFSLFASLSLFSFFLCVLIDPGHVPSSYVPDAEFANDNAERKKCDKCFAYKPPRTHHCRVCRRCVLKMDHHCLWVNNCIGYWNYKAFFVFVLYASLASIYSAVLFISCVLQKDWEPIKGSSLKIFYVMYGTMILALTATLVTLCGWHVYLILHNMTTIEVVFSVGCTSSKNLLFLCMSWMIAFCGFFQYYEGIRAKWLAMKSGQSYRHPFDIGAYKNITLILGPNMLKWLCPTAVSHLKDGVSFPALRDSS